MRTGSALVPSFLLLLGLVHATTSLGCDGGSPSTSASTAAASSVASSSSAAAASSSSSGAGGAGGAPEKYPAFTPPPPIATSLGGKVLASPRVVAAVFDADPFATELEAFVAELGAGKDYWKATTSEYGVGALREAITVRVHAPPPASATTADVAAWLEQQTTGATPLLGAFDPQTMYVVFYPQETNVVLEGSGPQCKAFGGYHLDAARADGGDTTFSVLPRCPGQGALTSLDITTLAASHEIVEGAADPRPVAGPAYEEVDDDHLAWAVSFSDYPVGEIGDLCALTTDDAIKPKGFTHTVQRTWSNEAAKAGKDPCVPAPDGAVYFGAVPLANDVVELRPPMLPAKKTRGVRVPVGGQATIDVQLFSDAPLDAWTVEAIDLRSYLGEPKRLALSLDRATGANGDVLHLTVQKLAKGPVGGTPFAVYARSLDREHVWFTFAAD